MVDIGVKSDTAWVCHSHSHPLTDILLPVHMSNKNEEGLSQCNREDTNWSGPVLLEQMEEGTPCVLTVCCNSQAAICRLLVISEARTMEVYSHTGEYCGTVRGARDDSVQPDSADRGPFYKNQLILENPSSACEVKLLSLAGRTSVLVCRVIVGLKSLQSCPVSGPGIDMEQVQSLVEEMGTNLSPGAQNLMEMVQFQQKNQTGSLGGFLPLLMGGGAAFSAFARGVGVSPAAIGSQLTSPDAVIRPAHIAPPPQNGAMSEGSTTSSPDLSLSSINTSNTTSSENGGTASHAQLADMMSHLLKRHADGQALNVGPEVLSMLQNVCGQVTQLRLDDAAAAEREKMMRSGPWELDSTMERRLEEMEKRLKEHMDRRLDALEQKLERVLVSALPLVVHNHGAMSTSGAETTGSSEQITPPSPHALSSELKD